MLFVVLISVVVMNHFRTVVSMGMLVSKICFLNSSKTFLSANPFKRFAEVYVVWEDGVNTMVHVGFVIDLI